jgi:hypothetical protein
MQPAGPQHWQHTIMSAVSFVALLTNFLVALAPLPQAITVHQVRRLKSTLDFSSFRFFLSARTLAV